MGAGLRNQIYSNLNSKDTEELLDIWKTNDRVEWSDLAFEVLKEISTERMGTFPKQNKPILEKDEEEPADDLEDWEAKLLDSEDQPELYDTLEVIDTVDNINKVAKAVIVVYTLVYLFDSYFFQALWNGGISSVDELMPVFWSLFTTIFMTAVRIAVVYFPLKALAYILRILVEMEFNSRKR
jgi:hypothetical protein